MQVISTPQVLYLYLTYPPAWRYHIFWDKQEARMVHSHLLAGASSTVSRWGGSPCEKEIPTICVVQVFRKPTGGCNIDGPGRCEIDGIFNTLTCHCKHYRKHNIWTYRWELRGDCGMEKFKLWVESIDYLRTMGTQVQA